MFKMLASNEELARQLKAMRKVIARYREPLAAPDHPERLSIDFRIGRAYYRKNIGK
jgi:hypothetical protein